SETSCHMATPPHPTPRQVSVLFRLQGQPNVVRVHSTYEDRRDIHIVMELCSGGELFDEINRRCDEMTVPY
ncbi:unnamed protein product, partial [Closterium sp. NIES-53]